MTKPSITSKNANFFIVLLRARFYARIGRDSARAPLSS
jgi:hypothetical protein